MIEAGAIGRLGDMTIVYSKHSEETVSGVCGNLSTGEPSLLFPTNPQGRRSGESPREISRVAIAVGKNATRRRVSRIILASIVNASSLRRWGLYLCPVFTNLTD